jgi:hypothetical protein
VYPKAKECHGDRSAAEWSHPLLFSSGNKRWLDFARHDTPLGIAGLLASKTKKGPAERQARSTASEIDEKSIT